MCVSLLFLFYYRCIIAAILIEHNDLEGIVLSSFSGTIFEECVWELVSGREIPTSSSSSSIHVLLLQPQKTHTQSGRIYGFHFFPQILCPLTANRTTLEGKQKIKSCGKLKGVDEVQCLCVVVCCRVQIVGSEGVWSESNRGSKQEGAPHLMRNCRLPQFYQYSMDAGCHLIALLSIHRHTHHSIG